MFLGVYLLVTWYVLEGGEDVLLLSLGIPSLDLFLLCSAVRTALLRWLFACWLIYLISRYIAWSSHGREDVCCHHLR